MRVTMSKQSENNSIDFKTWCEQNNRNELLLQWNYNKNNFLPNEVRPHSDKKVWWKCSLGHEWQALLSSRTGKKPCGCPICSGRKILSGYNDFETWCKNNERCELLESWNSSRNDILPNQVSPQSGKRIWWKCSLGHEWQVSVSNRIRRNCPYCSGNKTLSGYNDLETWCKKNNRGDLIQEWNYNRNNISPTQISPRNNRKVWWVCSLGHEWKATVGSRTGGKSGRASGCPYCSFPVRKILVGFNDFETKCKENNKEYLLSEWNYERNIDISPQSVAYKSGKRVWWKCIKGHEWQTTIVDRVFGNNCPICSRIGTSFPEQAIAYYLGQEFNIIQRYRINGKELDIYLEDYKIGIEYDGLRFHSSLISDKREEEKDAFFNSLGISVFRIKENINSTYVTDNTVFYIKKNRLYLEDSFNLSLSKLFDLIGKKIGKEINLDINIIRDELLIREHYTLDLKNHSVAIMYPYLVSEWDIEKNNGLTPDMFSASAHTKVWWKCSNGHNWKATIASRNKKLGCPYCAGQRLIVGQNDLETWALTNNKSLLQEWDYNKNVTSPKEEMKTSNKKVWWRCSLGHEWQATIANRVHGTRCPLCYTGLVPKRKQISFKEWCMINDNEQLLSEWDIEKNGSLSPDDVSKATHTKVWWLCSQGHSWNAEVKSRLYNHGCPYCSKTYKKALIGVNDLVTWCKQNNKEYIIEEWDYDRNEDLKPEMFTHGSHKRINWKCVNGHTWNAVIKERTKFKGNQCPICKNNTTDNLV